jgi:hypothetical protein
MLTRRNKKNAQQVAAVGGMMDDAGEVVNGTEVPAGSLAKEVADDVPAMLSEGEFVVPADVVRFVGLERLMKMRDKAKEGLERMEDVGQMGNAEEVGDPDQPFDQDDDAFESEIDSILAEDGAAMQTEQMFAAGGYVSGSDVSKATRNPAVDVRYYKHSDGRVMYVTFINDKPMTAVPDGFSQVSAEDARQVGRKAEEREKKAEEREKAKPVNDPADGGSGTDGRDDNDNQANRDVRAGGVFGGGDGSKGYDSGDVPGAGISIAGQDAAFKALNAAQYAKKAAIVNPLIGGALYLGGKGAEAYLDNQIDKMSAAYQAVAAPPALPGMGTFAARDGGISTISNQEMLDKSDMSMFGVTSAQLDAERAARLAGMGSSADVTIGGGISTPNIQGTALGVPSPGLLDPQQMAENYRAQDLYQRQVDYRAQKAENEARAEAQRQYDARVAAERKAEADRARAAQRAAEQRARQVASDPGGWSDSQRSEAAETGMVSVGGVSVSNDATIAAQNEAMFGGDSNNGGGGGGSNDGTYCCSRMVHLGEWTETKELARMHIWHHKQPEWWKAGYSVWGKVVANTLFKKKGFWTDVMNAFYARHIKNQPRTLKSTIADLVIYPGVFVCSMIWRNAPETTRYVPEDEMK